MDKPDIFDIPNFEYSPKGFTELKTALKAGKIVKNPFAKFYGEKVEVTIVQDENYDEKMDGRKVL